LPTRPGILIGIMCLLLASRSAAQSISRYNTFSYNVNEGLLQSTIGQLAIDKNNICWISFPNGIQQFDGNNFKTIKIQPGLPDDKYVKLFRCGNGDLLISHSQGISKYEIQKNGFTHVFKQVADHQKPVLFLGEDDGIIYFYDESATIRGMERGTFKIVSAVNTGMPSYSTQSENMPRLGENIVDHQFAFWTKGTICVWDLKNKKLVYRSPPITDRSLFFLRLLPGGKALYTNYTDNDALQCWDFATATAKKLVIQGKDKDKQISRFITFRWQDKWLVAINNHIYETDSTFQVQRSELVNFQNQPVAGNLGIADIKEDNFGNLYLQTITGGIRKIIRNNYHVKYYGSLNKEDNIVIGILPDKKNNRLLVGTSGAGLFVFDTMQRLTRHIPKHPANASFFGINSIVKDNNGDYLLLVMGEKKIWKLSADLSTFTHHPISFSDTPQHVVDYFGSTIYRDAEGMIAQSMYQVYRTQFAATKTTAHRVSGEYTLGRLWYNNKIVYHVNDELIFLDDQRFREIRKIPFPNTGGVRCLAKDSRQNILLGTNKGVFRVDSNGKILYHWNKEKGLPDDCIYAIAIDKTGHLWCSSNKGIFRIDNSNNILQLTREDGLQENEFNTGVVAIAEDGELFFGGMNGVSSFFPSAISSFDEKIKLLITRIRVNNTDLENDSAVWNIDKIKLPYNQNSLSFDFIAMANNNPAQYIYQYKMKGIDNEWLQVSGLQTVRYSLPPGKYTLQLYASRSFDKDAKPMKELVVIIQPPFWKTWWFRIGLSVLLVSLLTYGINQRNKRKYAKKIQQLENERQIKQERERISKDLHDSLGAYANAVLYNTDLLEKEKQELKRTELIGGLKFASKDIITSLRETVWALKKESYTAEDCLVRIRNFIQPFTRYYEHIHFRVIGEAPAERVLHYTKALNLVRIVQEAISNSIKHAHPASIQVTSTVTGDEWKLVITDNGKGFDLADARKTEQGNGLLNMEHRATEAGFDLTLETILGAGTTITIIV
jgi:signal transduction histidine kinase